jgi:HNH endonuclease/NUMOD4 motif-containing protein
MNNKKEIWKPIPEYESFYEISTHGRIRKAKSKQLLKTNSNQPYYQVWLNKNGLREIKKVHQLVALTFLGEPPEGCIVNHIDLNTHNNQLSNLEYITRPQNIQHAALNGAWKKSVSRDLADKIRADSNAGYSFAQLMDKYQLSRSIVTKICKRVGYLYSEGGKIESIKHRKVKITEDKARQIKALWESGRYSQSEIARMIGINITTVCLICNDKYSVKHLQKE